MENWIQKLKNAEKTSFIQDGKRKVHYTFEDKTEMAEEYSIQTGEILVRKWRKKSTLGASLPWEFEIGSNNEIANNKINDDIVESSSNPIFTRQDTKSAFQWRIRNLFYPADNYLVELDESQRVIVVKTKNKKYYKKFNIQDLDRTRMLLSSKNLNHSFSNNTLIIQYAKPSEFIEMEKMIFNELSKTKSSKDGEIECNPS